MFTPHRPTSSPRRRKRRSSRLPSSICYFGLLPVRPAVPLHPVVVVTKHAAIVAVLVDRRIARCARRARDAAAFLHLMSRRGTRGAGGSFLCQTGRDGAEQQGRGCGGEGELVHWNNPFSSELSAIFGTVRNRVREGQRGRPRHCSNASAWNRLTAFAAPCGAARYRSRRDAFPARRGLRSMLRCPHSEPRNRAR